MGAPLTSLAGALAAVALPPARDATRQNGFDATVWRAELIDGRTVAVRWLRPGVAPDRELQALQLATERGHPAPEVVATGRHDGRSVIVTAWCPGRTIGELLIEGGDPLRLGRLFGRAHAELHRPGDDGQVLCHLDFQPFNILVEGERVTGIVDWANAQLGDRRDDLAWTRAVLALARPCCPISPIASTLSLRPGNADTSSNARCPTTPNSLRSWPLQRGVNWPTGRHGWRPANARPLSALPRGTHGRLERMTGSVRQRSRSALAHHVSLGQR